MKDVIKDLWTLLASAFRLMRKQIEQVEIIVDANDNLCHTYSDKTLAFRNNEKKRDEIEQAKIDKELADLLKTHKSNKSEKANKPKPKPKSAK